MLRFIFPIVLLLFAASLYISYIGPGFDEIKEIKQDIQTASSTLAVRKKEIEDELSKLKSKVDSIDSEDQEKLARLIPQQEDFDEAGFVNDMNNIAIMHKLVIEGVRFSNQLTTADGADNDAGGVSEDVFGDVGIFSMSFGVESTYDEFILFMNDIEKNEQLIDVDLMSFNTSDTGVYKYEVSLVTYWLK